MATDKTFFTAAMIQRRPVDDGAPNVGDALVWDGTKWAPAIASGGAPAAHHLTHENGGADEISVAGLSGELADPQPPKAHHLTHESGGADAVKLDDLATPDDNLDLNVSTARHGLCPKAPNDPAQFLDGGGSWSVPPIVRMANRVDWREDFIGGSQSTGYVGAFGWTLVNSGGAQVFSAGEAYRPGIWRMYSGATAASYASAVSAVSADRFSILPAAGLCFEIAVKIAVLPDKDNDYKAGFGWGDSNNSVDNTDGVWFEVMDYDTGGNWYICAANNGTRTRTDSGVAVVANTWTVLRCEMVNSGGTLYAYFYIDDIYVGRISANVPQAAGRECAPWMVVKNDGGVVGTSTDRYFYIDYFHLYGDFPGGR